MKLVSTGLKTGRVGRHETEREARMAPAVGHIEFMRSMACIAESRTRGRTRSSPRFDLLPAMCNFHHDECPIG